MKKAKDQKIFIDMKKLDLDRLHAVATGELTGRNVGNTFYTYAQIAGYNDLLEDAVICIDLYSNSVCSQRDFLRGLEYFLHYFYDENLCIEFQFRSNHIFQITNKKTGITNYLKFYSKKPLEEIQSQILRNSGYLLKRYGLIEDNSIFN